MKYILTLLAVTVVVFASKAQMFGGGGGTGCSSCSAGGGADDYDDDDDDGVSMDISLGASGDGQSAGELYFNSSASAADALSPRLLEFSGSKPDVSVLRNTDNSIRQIRAPQTLTDVVTTGTNAYEVRFYYPSQIVSTNSSGLILVTGTPYAAWVVTNANPGTTNSVRITELRDGDVSRSWDYTAQSPNGDWQIQPAGNLVITVTTNWVWTTSDGYNTTTNRTRLTTQSAPDGTVVSRVKTTYQQFSWGNAPIEVAVGSDANPKVTTYTYGNYYSGAGGSFAPVESVTHPDGSWEYYKYDNDGPGSGRIVTMSSSSGDCPMNSWMADSTTYSYSLNDSIDDMTINPDVPRYVHKSGYKCLTSFAQYTLFPSTDTRLDVQCPSPWASWNDSDNLFTTNHYYSSGPNILRLQSVTHPDKTLTTYDYAISGDGYQTNITATGAPNGDFTSVIDGTSNRTVLTPFGYTLYTETKDIASGAVVARTTYGNFDSLARPQLVTYFDGTSEQMQYDCCTLLYSVDRDGVTNSYAYDALKRPFASARLNITNSTVLDPVGRVLQSIRTGTNGNAITLNQSLYDVSGELLAQTNALNGVTTYVETPPANGSGKTRAITYPDLGTRIEEYYLDGTLKKVTGSAVFPVRYVLNDYYFSSSSSEIKLDADGNDTAESTSNYRDGLGQIIETDYADGSASHFYYNNNGQLWKQVDPDGVVMFYIYNAKGEREYSINGLSETAWDNSIIPDYPSLLDNLSTLKGDIDRINYTTNDVISAHETTVRRTRTYAWDKDYMDSSNLVSMTEVSTDGLQTWQTTYTDASTPVVSHTQTVYAGNGFRYMTNIAPDNSYTVSIYQYGRLQSITRKDANSVQIAQTTYGYDEHGRQYTVKDARNGTTFYDHNDADQVMKVTTPAPGNGQPAQITTTYYNQMMQVTNVMYPDLRGITNEYFANGLLKKTYGAREYPVAYTYDYAGRMQTMTTWTNYSSDLGAAVTTWKYDGQRGWLTNKAYADENGPSYTYTHAGRLKTRMWARGITTTYTYGFENYYYGGNLYGELSNISYDDGTTPSVTYGYDRRGRQIAVTNGDDVCLLTYNNANEPLTESWLGGTLDGLTVSNHYDALLRRDALTLNAQLSTINSTAYDYDAASRLQTVTSGNNSATYNYLANSPLVRQIQFKQGSASRMTTTKTYDDLNRLTTISSAPGGSGVLPLSFNYNYNSANQRTAVTNLDNSHWVYQYDSLGQAISGKRYWSDGTPVAGQQFEYKFDDIGNRTQTKSGGTNLLWTASYTANNLNQYTSRDVPGTNDVTGAAWATNSVTVNGQTANRKGEYFQALAGTNNTAAPAWLAVKVSSRGITNTGNLFLPQTPETFGYDADGNLTNDGRWTYIWDAENRLVNMTSLTNAPTGSMLKLDFAYDFKGRRVQKIVSTNDGTDYVPQYTNRFVYDGWNLLATLDPQSSILQSFVWGTDLSGSMQGAGGVGGLLMVKDATIGTGFCAYDGNGNMAGLINAADGTIAAHYEYGPFGEVIRSTGLMAKNNPFRFSTKYTDDESDLLYYGYRYYKPSTGTWPNRDPLGEPGFEVVKGMDIREGTSTLAGDANRYLFVDNNPLTKIDPDGSYTCADVCGLANGDQRLNSGLGGVVCFKGMKCACVFNGAGRKVGDCPKLDAILLKHENEHAKQHSCDTCIPNMYRMRGPESEECEGRKQTLNELLDYLNNNQNKASKQCLDAAEKIAGAMQGWITANCH